jgi:hypothetical protein
LHRDSFLAKVPGFNPDAASGNTTSPYCRAVSSNNLDINEIENHTYRLALTLLAYGNSRFFVFKFTKPAYGRQLQAPKTSQALSSV